MSDEGRIERFEDLIAWQKARLLTRQVYEITSDSTFSRDRALTDQIRRAAVSIMSNIAEGFERASLPEFNRFLLIAKGSCAEVRSQLYVARDAGHISQATFDVVLGQAIEVGKVIGGLRTSVERKRARA